MEKTIRLKSLRRFLSVIALMTITLLMALQVSAQDEAAMTADEWFSQGGSSDESAPSASAASTPALDSSQTLNEQVQDLKQQVIELNRDLFILEEELLFPANTQVAVYLSMNVGKFFQLDAVKLTLDDKVVTNYLYTDKQVDALHRGGVQRLYLGNIKTGDHELVAVFTGRGPAGRDFRRGSTIRFDKTADAKNIELRIVDSTAKEQPEFLVKEW